jgi:hypothetical protein
MTSSIQRPTPLSDWRRSSIPCLKRSSATQTSSILNRRCKGSLLDLDGLGLTEEARIEQTEGVPPRRCPGWFVVNLAEARWERSDLRGEWTELEPPDGFENYGIGVRVLDPGQPNGKYHSENV